MPFKLKLKKTRQYNVASKSLFVISVELLDGGVADCTLSVDSSGQECLDNVCQRQAINQPEFFGLRYIDRNQQPRWVQLDRPLKRQLDKYASSHQLYLRVMYYVISGTSLITDEVTRYHYFLQLKNDLVEGRIICDCQQAVLLASYSRQAEYGNHDRERHTVEYLKNLLTFPKQILDGGQIIDGSNLAESGKLEYLTAAVIQHHMALHNMSQAQAEEGFITTCQQLRGYGQEMFAARDQRDQGDVTVAIALTGIRVLADNSDTPHFYRWMDITNVINHKRTFSIECCRQPDSASFTLASPDDGKYVWRMCIQQHTFYMRHQRPLNEPPHPEQRPKFQEHGLSESREELDAREPREVGSVASVARLQPLTAAHRARSTSCLELNDQPPRNRALLPQYRAAPDYETAIQQKYQQQRAEAQVRYQSPAAEPARHDCALGYLGYPLLGRPELGPMHYVNVYKPPPPYPCNGLASNSTPDLAVASQALNYHRGYINSHVSGSSPDLVSTRTALNRQYLGYLNTGSRNVLDYGREVLPPTHGTYNNLASVLEPNPHIIIDPHHISDNIQKVYDERGNIMYSMPMHRPPYQRHIVLPQTQQLVQLTDAQEPIYENVPLPWRGDQLMRDRARSLTTTDEIARLNERNRTYKQTLDVPSYHVPSKTDNPDGHYVNAQIIKGVRESSVPRSIHASDISINKNECEFENVALSVERLSLKDDETPYQSLSVRASNNNIVDKENVTSIAVDQSTAGRGLSMTDATSALNITDDTKNTTVSSKEKKRRRWGVFMGRGAKPEVRSATLGRDRAKPAPQPANKHRWSTGLPKFQPLPPSITKETLCQLLERKMSEEQISFAFERLPKGREKGGSVQTALLSQHAALNGPPGDGLPYDDNRVRLRPTPANPHGYINASHVTMTVGSSQRFYVVIKVGMGKPAVPHVAGQGGLTGSGGLTGPGALGGACGCGCSGVWECAWQVGARLIALVGDDQHPHYLPKDNTTVDFGEFQVSCRSWSAAAWGATARVRVRSGGRARDLWHVAYRNWPANKPAPTDVGDFLGFLSEVNSLRLACSTEVGVGTGAGAGAGAGGAGLWPLVVCGARASRAGVALAADLLLHILDNNQELDIARTVGMLHQQRAGLLSSAPQYGFLHRLLLHYLQQSRLI